MTSPQGKSLDRQAETVERRLIKWAVADVHPQNAAGKIASEARRLEVRGREKLIRRLGIKRVEAIEHEGKLAVIRSWKQQREQRGFRTTDKEVKEAFTGKQRDLAKEAGFTFTKSRLVYERKGFFRYEREDGSRVWRDSKGRYSKGPRRR